jgi:hypothetical protein
MGFGNPFRNVFRSIISSAAKANQTFTQATKRLKQFTSFASTKLVDFSHDLADAAREHFSKTPGPTEVSRFLESEAWEKSKKAIGLVDYESYVPDDLKIGTLAKLKGKHQYLFEFQGKFKGGFERVNPIVSILSDEELTIEEATNKMYEQILNRRGDTWQELVSQESLTFMGERTRESL